MKVCVTADFHGLQPPEIPDCDLLIFAGDLGVREAAGPTKNLARYRRWFEDLGERDITVVGVAGNHDFESAEFGIFDWVYLENEVAAVAVAGEANRVVTVWGSPLSPTFGRWAHMRDEDALWQVYETIPDDVDIIISHGPPRGYRDLAQGRTRAGSVSLTRRLGRLTLDRERPLLVACGHIHEGYGAEVIGSLTVANGSWVDDRYRPGNPPIVVEL